MFEGLFQPMHLLVIFGIALLVFGPKKLSELGKGIGEDLRGFKAAIRDEDKSSATTTTAHGSEPAFAQYGSPLARPGASGESTFRVPDKPARFAIELKTRPQRCNGWQCMKASPRGQVATTHC